MAITKTRSGTNPDGTPHWTYTTDTEDGHLLVTGPAAGIVRAADGTEYVVDEDVIEVASLEHAQEVAHQIGQQHMRRGTFGEDWVHQFHPDVAARFENHTPLGEALPPDAAEASMGAFATETPADPSPATVEQPVTNIPPVTGA
jgi:hypothetical protein